MIPHMYIGMINKIKGEFAGTYLKTPILQMKDGKTYEGWDEVAPALLSIVNRMTFVSVQAAQASEGPPSTASRRRRPHRRRRAPKRGY